MTEQLINLDLHCNEQRLFFLKTRRQKTPGNAACSNGKLATSQQSKHRLPTWMVQIVTLFDSQVCLYHCYFHQSKIPGPYRIAFNYQF